MIESKVREMTDEGKVAILNPNSSVAVTQAIFQHLQRTVGGDRWYCVTNRDAPEFISSADDFQRVEKSMIKALTQRSYAAIVVAAFGDPGVGALRESGVPVVGMGSASMFAASAYGRFGVVTALQQHRDLTMGLVERLGLMDQCVGMWPIGMDPLEVTQGGAEVHARFLEVSKQLTSAGANAICMGSSSLATLVGPFRAGSPAPLVDGLALALRVALDLPAANT